MGVKVWIKLIFSTAIRMPFGNCLMATSTKAVYGLHGVFAFYSMRGATVNKCFQLLVEAFLVYTAVSMRLGI